MLNKQSNSSHIGTGIWECFHESNAIKQWTDELLIASNIPLDEQVWTEIGQAVVLEHHDVAQANSLVTFIALEAGMNLLIIDAGL